MEAIVVFITAGSAEEAGLIASALLESRLAACVNQVQGVDSRFWWQGSLDRADETMLIAKTRRDLWPEVLDTVKKHHSYEVFEAIALPVVESNPDYLNWILDSTKAACSPNPSAGDIS